VEPTLHKVGGQGARLLFAHANGFPPGSYAQLFARLGADFDISALEHRPLWGGREPPRRLRWSLFADDMLALLRKNFAEPVWVMGHSMGATTAVLAAARDPERFAGLILLDPVFLPDRLLFATRLMPERQRRKMPMIRRALARPEHFADYDAAFEFYRSKRAFAALSDEVLRDYVHASKQPAPNGGVQLRYSGAWEAAVYGSAPPVRRALRGLALPTLGLRGRHSDTLRPEIWSRWAHWQPSAVLRELPGGHLFPLEHPAETAEAVRDYIFQINSDAAL
jgi:pimeloyl-ACP methyl ester carboxylesterase